MASSPSPTSANPDRPAIQSLPRAPELVWGAASTEMLEAEQRGDIVLIEDVSRHSRVDSDGADRHKQD